MHSLTHNNHYKGCQHSYVQPMAVFAFQADLLERPDEDV